VRHKLLALVLVPLLLVLPALGVVLLAWGNSALDQLLITKIRSDLAVAQGYFERVLGEVGSSTASVAESHALHQAIEAADEGRLVTLLQALRAREGLDFIQLRRPDGSLWLGDSGPARGPEPTSPTSPARAAVAQGGTSVEVLSPEQLAVLGPSLAARVSVPLVDTRNAAPTDREREDRAMVLLSTRAVLGTDASPLGHLQAGLLLNRNLPFIDHINEIVYPAGSLPYGSRGTSTLFLDDVRISTNVRLFGAEQDERAIGTRVSQAVREVVLGSGRTWLDRAFVVNDWYVSAYEPLQDSAGRRVGMLYVGFTEEPFRWIKISILLAIGVTSFLVMIAGRGASSRRWRPWPPPCGAWKKASCRPGWAAPAGTTRSASWLGTWTTCWTPSTTRPAPCSVGTPSWTRRCQSARRSWKPRRASWCGRKSWPPWAS
jgi:two-component system NtrC family sensor kinase